MERFYCNGKKDFCDNVICMDDCEFYNDEGGEYMEVPINTDEGGEYMEVPINTGTIEIVVTLDDDAIMPTLAHDSDVGYDLYSREDAVIYQNGSGRFDTGVHIKIPENVCGLLVSKSGLDHKNNLQSTGLIDPEYVGSIWVKLYNHGPKAVEIKKGQKISQIVFLPVLKPNFVVADKLEDTERGANGFGSTGKF